MYKLSKKQYELIYNLYQQLNLDILELKSEYGTKDDFDKLLSSLFEKTTLLQKKKQKQKNFKDKVKSGIIDINKVNELRKQKIDTYYQKNLEILKDKMMTYLFVYKVSNKKCRQFLEKKISNHLIIDTLISQLGDVYEKMFIEDYISIYKNQGLLHSDIKRKLSLKLFDKHNIDSCLSSFVFSTDISKIVKKSKNLYFTQQELEKGGVSREKINNILNQEISTFISKWQHLPKDKIIKKCLSKGYSYGMIINNVNKIN